MKHLKIWQKLALLGAVFMVPFAVVVYKMTVSVNALALESAQRELQGLDYYVPTLALMKDLQRHRGATNAVLKGDQTFTALLASAKTGVQNDIAALDAIDGRLNPALRTTERWSRLRAAIQELLQSAATLSAEESFARHSRLISDLIAHIRDVGQASHLTLDPDADRMHLITALITEGPQLAEALARARGFGTAVVAAGLISDDDADQLRRNAIMVEFHGAKLDETVTTALDANEALRARLEPAATAASDAVLAAQAAIVHLAQNRRADTGAREYWETVGRSIESIIALEGVVGTELRSALDARISVLRQDVMVTLVLAGLGVLIVLLIAIVIIRDITKMLRQVVDVANQIAAGDVRTSVKANGRTDELGVLAGAFERMMAALKETADIAQRIASGDLTVTVTPRTDNDIMRHALLHMLQRLSALVGDVQRSGIQVNTSVNQIAATAKQQQATATEIAATTTQISATSKEIAATSRELVRTMSEVSSVAEQSAMLAGSGQAGVSRMEGTMRHVMEAAGSINAKLAVLNEKAGGITQVVTTITKVADQTNLLSLNAAIEAEKAGEYGRGFAVVATEIRRLADQTAVATYDIEQMVREIQSAVSAGVMGMDKFSEEVRRGTLEVQQVGEQLSQIIAQVQALPPRFDAVTEGMEAQAIGAEQITQALAQLGEAVHQTVESLRESNQAIDGLNHAAGGMRSGVSRFKIAA